MEESGSNNYPLYPLARELCEESEREKSVKHFVFEDILDTHEKLICYCGAEGPFRSYSYVLRKEKSSFFSKEEERELGCYLGYLNGSLYTFEDFNFKIQSFEDFTLLTEAVEVNSGESFFFQLCNVCELPEFIPKEQQVALTLYAEEIKLLPPLSKFDQIADENRELLKLALKGNPRAIEKLEREIGEKETKRLLSEVRSSPEETFDTCVFSSLDTYQIIGVITAISRVNLRGRELVSIDVLAEDMDFTILVLKESLPSSLSEGERLMARGKMFGVAVMEEA